MPHHHITTVHKMPQLPSSQGITASRLTLSLDSRSHPQDTEKPQSAAFPNKVCLLRVACCTLKQDVPVSPQISQGEFALTQNAPIISFMGDFYNVSHHPWENQAPSIRLDEISIIYVLMRTICS